MREVICDCSGHVKGEHGGGKITVRDLTQKEMDDIQASFVQHERPKTKLEILEEEIEKLKAAISNTK